MIPNHNHDDVLPPFIPGDSPADPGAMAPYRVELSEFVHRFGNSNERREILKGLVSYRNALRVAGITSGFQWLDGSFVENCEKTRNRPPNDIDIITFSMRPQAVAESGAWRVFVGSRPDLFDPETTKKNFKCDAYFVDLGGHPIQIVNLTRYWFGLFSHQRDTYLWKGMIEIPFDNDDKDVERLLSLEVEDAS